MSTPLVRSVSMNSGYGHDHQQKRQEWSKMHDRKLNSDERKKMAIVMGQHRSFKLEKSQTDTRNPINPDNINLSNPEMITRGLNKDLLTLACYNAIATGQIGLLKAIYKTGKAPQVDKQGNTPLHVAARCGQLRSLRWLMQYSSTPVQAKNQRGETPVHVAGLHGNLKCLQALVSTLTTNLFEVIAERDNMGMTVLHHATIGNRDNIVEWLTEQFGKDLCLVKSIDGVLAIHLASAAGNSVCTQNLAIACSQTINMRDIFGATAAFYAAQEGHLPCLEYLVEEAGSDLGIVACEGMTAILTAAEGGHLDVLRYILSKQGPSVLLESTNDGATVFHYASGNGHYQILKYLLDLPNTSDLLRLCDTHDRSPAHDAAENGHVDCLKLILDAGMSVYQPDKDGETPLSLALKCGNPKCAMFAKVVSETAIDKNSLKEMKKKAGSKFSHISNILTIHALSKSDAKHLKSGNGTMPVHQKKNMVRNLETFDTGNMSMKSEGIYVWPSWQRSLASRGANRPTNRGIFRGEFILLRSAPPGNMTTKTRKVTVPNRNGHLYAQRNRPCPISLPLQKHEYPTHINQMDLEDDINAEDIERFFKQPLDVIPEYGNSDSKPNLHPAEEEEDDSCHELDDDNDEHFVSYPYATRTLDHHFGLKEAQTSFSIWDRRPYRRARPYTSSLHSEDYSSDESGISTESGISSHSDDDKNGYHPSSSDESGTSKRFSDSGDSAVKDSYCLSSDDEDLKEIKQKKSEYLSEIILRKEKPKVQEKLEIREQVCPIPTEKCNENPSTMSEGSDNMSIHSKPESTKSSKTTKRVSRVMTRKRSETIYSSDDEGAENPSASLKSLGVSSTRKNSISVDHNKSTSALNSCDSSTDEKTTCPKDDAVEQQREKQCPKPMVTESLASVLQRSMMETGDLKNTLKSNTTKDNTCKTVFNSDTLLREGKRKHTSREDSNASIVNKSTSVRSEMPLPKVPVSLEATIPANLHESDGKSRNETRIEKTDASHKTVKSTEKVQRSKSVTVSDLQKQLVHKIPCSQFIARQELSGKIRAPIIPPPAVPSIRTTDDVKHQTRHETGDEMYATPKTASKIKALQDVLIKQSLPFANPFLFKGNRVGSMESLPICHKEELVKATPKPHVGQPVAPPAPPPPPPPPPATLPATLPKVKKTESAHNKCVSYATTTKVQTEKDDCQLDDATKTRIASIKSMLERASVLDDNVQHKSSHEQSFGSTT